MQIFVQVNSHAIDVSKIEWLDLPSTGQVTVHMSSGAKLKLSRAAADALMKAIAAMGNGAPVRAINASCR